MNYLSTSVSALTLLVFLLTNRAEAQCYTQVWAEEFDGTELDRSKWNVEIGNGYPDSWGWGNEEVQYYTDHEENLSVSNGTLKITAIEESFGGHDYTSARIRSKGNFDFKYGVVDARIKITGGQGLWPAWWMLPTYNVNGGWPGSGEIDIMENFGHNNYMSSTLHYWTHNDPNWHLGWHQYQDDSYNISMDEWHNFSCIWQEDKIDFYVDWNWVGSHTPESLVGDGIWPFNEDFYLILNMALGGSAGNVSTSFPKTMEVDYVHVLQLAEDMKIQGPESAFNNETLTYSLAENSGATYSWSVTGGTILSGAGTSNVTVQWGANGGVVNCDVTDWQGDVSGTPTNCGTGAYTMTVDGEGGNCDTYYLDFDKQQNMQPTLADGSGGIETFFEVNPGSNSVNPSTFVGRFGRSGDQQYDALKLDFTESFDASGFKTGDKQLKIDVYSAATGDIPVTVQFVNRAKDTGYPSGVHSQHSATLSGTNQWKTLTFNFLETADWSIQDEEVDGINILFAAGNNLAENFYFDNIRSSAAAEGSISGSVSVSDEAAHTYAAPEYVGATYSWTTDGNVAESNQSDNSIDLTFTKKSATYSTMVEVEIETADGCVVAFEKSVTVVGSTGIEAVEAVEWSVYPNPSSGVISLDGEGIEEVKLISLDGKMVLQTELLRLDVRDLAKGTYLLAVRINGAVHHQLVGVK